MFHRFPDLFPMAENILLQGHFSLEQGNYKMPFDELKLSPLHLKLSPLMATTLHIRGMLELWRDDHLT